MHNDMIYFYIYAFLAVIFFIALAIWKILKLKNARKMGFPTHTSPYTDDAIEQAREMSRFLLERGEAAGVPLARFSETGLFSPTWDMSSGRSYDIIALIRLCHRLGCEIVIRQVGTDDLEKTEHTPEVLREKVFRITGKR